MREAQDTVHSPRPRIWPLLAVILAVVALIQSYSLFRLSERIELLEAGSASGASHPAEQAPAPPGRAALSAEPLEPLLTGSGSFGLFEELRMYREEAERAFGEAYWRFQASTQFGPGAESGPTVEVAEDSERYIVRLRPPAGRQRSYDVRFEEGLLKVRDAAPPGEAALADAGAESTGFSKMITLPGPVDSSGMRSDWINGELVINLPKAG